jgi:hypothetical protein
MDATFKAGWLILAAAIVSIIYIQFTLYPHPDVLYLLHAASLLQAGHTYTHGFLETNPPLIMYLYLPAWYISKFLGLNLIHVFRLYIACLCIGSISWCFYLSKRLNLDPLTRHILIVCYALSLFLLPAHEAGQREHLFMLLSYPYIFLIMLRLDQQPISNMGALAIATSAAVGIALKPFFLTLPVCLELYYLYQKHSLRAIVRIETFCLVCLLSAYLAYVYCAFPDYFHTVMPLVAHLYFIGNTLTWAQFAGNLYVEYAYAGLFFYVLCLLLQLPTPERTLNNSLAVALWAFNLAFTGPRAAFFYHLLPGFSTAFILFAVLFTQILRSIYPDIPYRIVKIALLFFPLGVASLIIYATSYTIYIAHRANADPYTNQLVAFFKAHAPENSYLYLSSSNDAIFLRYYAQARYVGHYPAFWWELGLNRVAYSAQIAQDEQYLVNLIAANIAEEQPQFILMDTMIPATGNFKTVDYGTQFSKYAAFAQGWAAYNYLTTIGRFKIYEHKPSIFNHRTDLSRSK